MAKKRVSFRRPEGSSTSFIRIVDCDRVIVLRFNRNGVAKASKADAEFILSNIPSLELIEEEEEPNAE